MGPRSVFNGLAESEATYRVGPPEEQSPEDELWDRDQIDLAREAIQRDIERRRRVRTERDAGPRIERLCIAGHHVRATEASASTYCDGCRRSVELVPEGGPERTQHLLRLASEQREIAAWWRAQPGDGSRAAICEAEAARFERMANVALADAAE